MAGVSASSKMTSEREAMPRNVRFPRVFCGFCHIANRKWVDQKPDRSSPESLIVAYNTKGYETHETRNHLTESQHSEESKASLLQAIGRGWALIDSGYSDAFRASRPHHTPQPRQPDRHPPDHRLPEKQHPERPQPA
jgi:hypothetical protein